jgi:hypothetical protein
MPLKQPRRDRSANRSSKHREAGHTGELERQADGALSQRRNAAADARCPARRRLHQRRLSRTRRPARAQPSALELLREVGRSSVLTATEAATVTLWSITLAEARGSLRKQERAHKAPTSPTEPAARTSPACGRFPTHDEWRLFVGFGELQRAVASRGLRSGDRRNTRAPGGPRAARDHGAVSVITYTTSSEAGRAFLRYIMTRGSSVLALGCAPGRGNRAFSASAGVSTQ